MLKALETPFLEGDDKHTVLFATGKLLYINSDNKWTQNSFDDVASYFKEHIPIDNNKV